VFSDDAKVAVIIAAGSCNEVVLDEIKKSFLKKDITQFSHVEVSDAKILPFAAQNIAAKAQILLTVGLLPHDNHGLTQSLNSALLQVGVKLNIAVIPAIFTANSLLEVKAIIPELASKWVNTTAEFVEVVKGTIDHKQVVLPPAPPAPVFSEDVKAPEAILAEFRESLKVIILHTGSNVWRAIR